MSANRIVLMVVLFVLLAGCAVAPPVPVVELEYEDRAAELRGLTQWSLTGRAAFRTADDAGTVSLDWRQVGDRYSVWLRAPWGAGSLRVEGGPGAVMLRTADGVEAFATEPGQLLERYTGYQLPLEALRYWLLGIPDPAGEASVALDEQGLVTELRQYGWRIDYRRYQEVDGIILPATVFMRAEAMEVRVAVQNWEVEL